MHKKCFRAALALLIIAIILITGCTIVRGLFPRKHMGSIETYCSRYGVDTNLVLALIKTESNFNADAVSRANAKGIMQLTDDTFDYCMNSLSENDGDIFDPDTNLHAGIWYLSYLLNRYNGNVTNAVAAYNAGAANVDKWLSNPEYSSDGETLENIPFGETQRHAERISRYSKIYAFLY